MSWITVIWSAAAGACVMMGLMHLVVWRRDRRSWADFCFFIMVVGVLGEIVVELIMVHTDSPVVYGSALRWAHPSSAVAVVGSLGFIHFYFGTGRRSLLLIALGLRGLVLVMNFTTGVNIHALSIDSLEAVEFLGEPLSILGEWQTNPWFVLGPIAMLVQVAYMGEASLRLWRTGSRELRRRAVIVGGSLAVFYLGATIGTGLVAAGVLHLPFVVSLPFLATLVAMSYESSGESLRTISLGQAVRERDLDLALAVESAKLGFWFRDLATNQVRASDQLQKMFGFAPTERVNGDALRQRVHPDDRERLRETIEQAAVGDGTFDTEFRMMLPDGGIRWMSSRGRYEFGPGARPIRVRGVTLDVTEHKRSEDALRESEERFRNVANHAPVMLWMSDAAKVCNFVNKCWLDFTGRTFEQEQGTGWAEGVHPDDSERCLQTYSTSFDARQAFTMQYRLRRHDGEYCWVLDTGVPRFAGSGEFLGYIGSALDITPLKQAQEALQASEERFRLAVEGSPIAIVMVDVHGRILLVNVQAEAVFGYTRAELVGQSIDVLVPDAVRAHHGDLRAGFMAHATKRAMGAGRELFGRRKDGSAVPVEIGLNPIRSREGVVVLASIVDITERLQATKEVVGQRRELARMSRVAVLGELTASLAHELNQPLTAIMANAQTAARLYSQGRGTPEEFHAISRDIVADTTRARDVIRQVRGLVKVEEREIRHVNLGAVVEQVVGFLRSDAVAHGVAVAVEVEDALPPIKGELVQVQQVLLNFLLNAFDAMEGVPRNERRVDIAMARRPGGMIEVGVRDCGSGIPASQLEKIFDPFFTTKPEGMGMGLSVCRSIITELGGQIGAENNPERGARFWFRLPAAE